MSFFITGRFAGQADRVAFTDVVVEQLAELLNTPLPAMFTDATREAHLLRLLSRAAAHCRERGQSLVLVVDGLDEDRGVTVGPSAHSIAALLPPAPVPGLRIIVAGRPDPRIPHDVPDEHPLHDPSTVRALATSPHAQVVRQDAERELRHLLHGSATEQDLLGLLTASGGGLAGADLAELTGLEPWRVDEHLGAVSARTFTRRADAYVLAHEELEAQATAALASRLPAYRDRIDAWAETYRARGWPDGTPGYLLRGYFQLLHGAGDEPRMLACALDRARHERLLTATGADFAALSEIVATARHHFDRHDRPELVTLARLAVRRDELHQRNQNTPVDLPAVWAAMGFPDRAEAMARSMTDPGRRSQALTAVAAVLLKAGDSERSRLLAIDAAAATDPGSDLGQFTRAQMAIAAALLEAGDLSSAEAVARQMTDQFAQVNTLVALAGRHDLATARTVALEADSAAFAIADPFQQAMALAAVSTALVRVGERDRAGRALAGAQAVLELITEPEPVMKAFAATAEASIRTGQLRRARAVANAQLEPYRRALALTALAAAALQAGEAERACTIALSAEVASRVLDPRRDRAEALTRIASVLLRAGSVGPACLLTAEAEIAARAIVGVDRRAAALTAIALVLARAGDMDHAEAVATEAEAAAGTITSHLIRVQALTAVAVAYVDADAVERAEHVVSELIEPYARAEAMCEVAAALVRAGELRRAEDLALAAEAAARPIVDKSRKDLAKAALAVALVRVGAASRGEAVAQAVVDPACRDAAVAEISALMTGAGKFDEAYAAIRLIESGYVRSAAIAQFVPPLISAGELDRASAAIRMIAEPLQQSDALSAVSMALIEAGRVREAEKLVAELDDASGHDAVFADVISALVRVGKISRAEDNVRTAPNSGRRSRALAALVSALVDMGEVVQAERIVSRLGFVTPSVSTVLIHALLEAGDLERSVRFVVSGPSPFPAGSAAVMRALVRSGSDDLARALAVDAWDRIGRGTALFADPDSAMDVACMQVYAGQADRAEAVARSVGDPQTRTAVCEALFGALIEAGDPGGAERLASSPYSEERCGRLVVALAGAGHVDRAAGVARAIRDPRRRSDALRCVALTLIDGGDPEAATDIIADFDDPLDQVVVLAGITSVFVRAGRLDEATRTAAHALAAVHAAADKQQTIAAGAVAVALAGRRIAAAEVRVGVRGHPLQHAEALERMVDALLDLGDIERAKSVATCISHEERRAGSLARVVDALLSVGDIARAEVVARDIAWAPTRALVLARVATTYLRVGDAPRAEMVLRPDGVTGRWDLALAREQDAPLTALALLIGEWSTAVAALAAVDPDAVLAIADELGY
ncbi:hypothetical protein ACPPVO_39055 [Dactylosporangium sp. McL0621]|uniref:hypothetical protein n=1 Tax=Dactylosporangium sp. McL0621 TaxID=3415678 RepID=UPI003CF4ECAA